MIPLGLLMRQDPPTRAQSMGGRYSVPESRFEFLLEMQRSLIWSGYAEVLFL